MGSDDVPSVERLLSHTDFANNAVSRWVVRLASRPADHKHPYDHWNFEIPAVFVVSSRLSVLAIELAVRAFRRDTCRVVIAGWHVAARGHS